VASAMGGPAQGCAQGTVSGPGGRITRNSSPSAIPVASKIIEKRGGDIKDRWGSFAIQITMVRLGNTSTVAWGPHQKEIRHVGGNVTNKNSCRWRVSQLSADIVAAGGEQTLQLTNSQQVSFSHNATTRCVYGHGGA